MRRNAPIILCATLLLITGAAFAPAYAGTEPTATAIIDAMEALYQGDNSQADITMVVTTPRYQREMLMTSSNQGQEKSLIRILSPKKDRGIATLKLDREMWNYFPKINRVIKVPPSMMMGSWMGSDFTNDDLVKQTTLTEEYDLSLKTSEAHYLVTLIPRAQTVTVWGKIEYLVDREAMLPVAQYFYDDRGDKIRSLEFSDVRVFGEMRLPSRLDMIPHNKPGHKTTIIYNRLSFDSSEVDDSLFTLRHLKSRF